VSDLAPIVVERRAEQLRTTYLVRDVDGGYVDSLTFRDVMALVAASQGRVRTRWRCTYSPWYRDRHLLPECDDHGVGFGTLLRLQGQWHRQALIQPCGADEGQLDLTDFGRQVLDEIASLNGAEMRRLGEAA
jgi:hypothetical protein